MLDDLGLLETLKAFFNEYEERSKIKIRYELPHQEPVMIPSQEITVFRLIQESFTNIARHAHASEVDVIIKAGKNKFELSIHDNGIGIPRDKIESSESYGIMTMKERIKGWDGTFEIKGKAGAGTTISISLPIHQA
jgi:two-component system sensor histidine kinase DegS